MEEIHFVHYNMKIMNICLVCNKGKKSVSVFYKSLKKAIT